MNEIEVIGRAKINLALDVIGKRPDGYHDVRMLMQSIDLHDKVRIRKITEGIQKDSDSIRILTNSKKIPCDRRNIAYKAAELLRGRYGIKGGISIFIQKKIPVAAGLAGGSADAAAVLMGVNKLYSLEMSIEELCEAGKLIGADVPFCILGGAALAEGLGEILTPVSDIPKCHIVLVKPPVGVSTARVYGKLNLEEIQERPNIKGMIDSLKAGDLKNVCLEMKNVLELVTVKDYPVIQEIKGKLRELGAVGSMMSGSGPTVFGIFEDRSATKNALETFRRIYREVYLTRPSEGHRCFAL